jgi:hypothetical protein
MFGGAERRAYTMYCMNEFRLFAHGVDFDPESFLASTSLQFDGVWHKGESGRNHPKSSGVFKVLGDGQKVSIFEQEKIAIEYLSANQEALKALAKYPGVTTFILGLQYHIELEPGTIGFCMGPSASLMWHCLDIGVSPTFYVSLDRRREWESEQDAEPDAAADGGRDSGSS